MGNDVNVMMPGAIDPIAETKAVYFRPDSSTDVVRVGDLVCYNWDLETDYKERDETPISGGTAYAEGAQNYNGRLFVVEKPATANLPHFAGVVSRLGALAGADGDLIEIFIPNGATVPVMIDMDTETGRTIVGVRDGAYEGSYPGRPIGIAMEEVIANAADALCWVKLDPSKFMWGYDGSSVQTSLLIDDECGSAFTLNQMKVESAHTAGRLKVFSARAFLTGAGSSRVADFELVLTGTEATVSQVLNLTLWIEPSATWQATYADGAAAMRICIGSSATHPDMTGLGLSGISFQNYLVETGGEPEFLYPFWFHCGSGCKWDGLFYCDAAGLGIVSCGGDHTILTDDKLVPIKIGGVTHYLLALASNPNE